MDTMWERSEGQWEPWGRWERRGRWPMAARRRLEPDVPDPCSKVAEFVRLLHKDERDRPQQ